MGGYGSGKWYRWSKRDTVEDSRRLDVRALQRAGYLERLGVVLPWAWGTGERRSWITLKRTGDVLTLSFRHRQNGGEWQDTDQGVRLTWTPCNYGGRRPWFLCPGVVNGRYCGRRVAHLYGAGRYFLCRNCYGLAYECQREDEPSRALNRAWKIRHRLGGKAGLQHSFPRKPKGMHWRTYSRLRWEGEEAEYQATAKMLALVRRMDDRLNPLLDRMNRRAEKRTPMQGTETP